MELHILLLLPSSVFSTPITNFPFSGLYSSAVFEKLFTPGISVHLGRHWGFYTPMHQLNFLQSYLLHKNKGQATEVQPAGRTPGDS